MKKVFRCLPRRTTVFTRDPRILCKGQDHAGFTLVEVDLDRGEGVCWRCAGIAYDPKGTLNVCPHCGGDFND